MSKKKKYYVVWKGKKTGVFTSWDVCKKQTTGFEGAQYKAFIDKAAAEIAFTKSYNDYKGKDTKKVILSESVSVVVESSTSNINICLRFLLLTYPVLS